MNGRRVLLLAAMVAAMSMSTTGQEMPATLLFTVQDTHASGSGAGGTQQNWGNWSAIFGNQWSGVMASPRQTQPYFAYGFVSLSTWAVYFGDDRFAGAYRLPGGGRIDAIHVPPGASAPPTLFDCLFSFAADTGAAGSLSGFGSIGKGGVARYLVGGGVVPLILEQQVATAMAAPMGSTDINAFTIHHATGDLYWSLDDPSSLSGMPVQNGSIIRLPAANYTADVNGNVLAVVAGGAEIVFTEIQVDALFQAATGGGVSNTVGLEIDPGGGTFISPASGAVLPNLWIAEDNHGSGVHVITTGSGTPAIATINGVSLDSGPAFGLQPTSWGGGAVGDIGSLAFHGAWLPAPPLFLNNVSALQTPGTLKLDFGGATPLGPVYLVGRMALTHPHGLFTSRRSIFNDPYRAYLNVPGSFSEVYIFDPWDILTSQMLDDPPVIADVDGYGSRSFTVPSFPNDLGMIFQVWDATSMALSTPAIVVTL